MTTMTFGPESGTLHLLTGVEGKAARMGHDLVLDLPDWSAEADVTDGVPTAVRLRAGQASSAVKSGTGGAKALADKDRARIR
ncbi:MAG: YceI family protein, partial [Frankiales bacterium]|nr:YceI family protein [Frankiales bacterium]